MSGHFPQHFIYDSPMSVKHQRILLHCCVVFSCTNIPILIYVQLWLSTGADSSLVC